MNIDVIPALGENVTLTYCLGAKVLVVALKPQLALNTKTESKYTCDLLFLDLRNEQC